LVRLEGYDPTRSEAHNDWIDIYRLENFIHEKFQAARKGPETDPTKLFPPEVITAARILTVPALQATVDLRDLTKSKSNGKAFAVQKYMWSNYCMMSHTQPIERGVKLARDVSKSDRSEPFRSVYAILISNFVDAGISELTSTAKALSLFKSAEKHWNETEALKKEEAYAADFKMVMQSIRSQHFNRKREEELIATVEKVGNKLRAENKRQQSSGVDHTADVLGVIPYSSVTAKGGFLEALRVELAYRGYDAEEMMDMTISPLQKRLKADELERVKDMTYASEDERKHAVKLAAKSFRQLSCTSEAVFVATQGS
jgi:hypothetical protein